MPLSTFLYPVPDPWLGLSRLVVGNANSGIRIRIPSFMEEQLAPFHA